tara:strand:- start:287 stop:451 length:165 start_codon:yes stop_codon:yes gene_type:complete
MLKKIPDIERRLKILEELSHPPVNWEGKIESHERVIQDLYDRITKLENKLGDIL